MDKSVSINVTKLLKFIKQHDNFLLSTHQNSDGDAIASVLACSMLLDKLRKDHLIILDDQSIDRKYQFLKNFDKITSFDKSKIKFYNEKIKSALIFDAPGNNRIGVVASLLHDSIPTVKIDHHPTETNYGELDWVDTSSSSVSAMMFEIIENSSLDFDKHIYEACYTGIIYDTGRLSFSNTRSRDFEICSLCVNKGVKPHLITNNLFFNNNANALKVIGRGLCNLTQFSDAKITVLTLKNNDLNGVEQSEIEELANYSVSLRESEVGVFIRETEPGFFKLSLRSKEYVDVSLIARQFNGGGHARASGCRFEGKYNDLINQLVKHVEYQL